MINDFINGCAQTQLEKKFKNIKLKAYRKDFSTPAYAEYIYEIEYNEYKIYASIGISPSDIINSIVKGVQWKVDHFEELSKKSWLENEEKDEVIGALRAKCYVQRRVVGDYEEKEFKEEDYEKATKQYVNKSQIDQRSMDSYKKIYKYITENITMEDFMQSVQDLKNERSDCKN